ncbi:formyltransferase family protein [Streptomyces sp. 5.8]|uniref:formyltransferase family protein n=1 Tax=Streptomyces sp. 5.8 TaxID=3406571 RepID=UPI003BB685DE
MLPAHRGIPSVAVLFALLHGDPAYGATLHEIDAGIDTGPVLAERRFTIGPEDRFHQVMLRGIRACHALFEQTLPAVAEGVPLLPVPPDPDRAGDSYYGAAALARLGEYRHRPGYARATDLGAFAVHTPEVARAVRALAAGGDAPCDG